MPFKVPKESTGMLVDGLITVQTVDSSGEMVMVDGVDMSSFDTDGIPITYEHVQPDDSKKKGDEEKKTNGHELIGRMVFFKKLFSKKDCENDRQLMFFEQYNCVPAIYAIFRLADGANHDSAKALAALIREDAANGLPLMMRWSIEGSTLSREGNKLTSTVCRAVAITRRPCNKAASAALLLDPNAPEGWKKNYAKEPEKDVLAGLLEAKKSEHPLYRSLGTPIDMNVGVLFDPQAGDDLEKSLKTLIKAQLLIKTFTAGGGGCIAPSSLTGGAALGVESLRGRALAAVRDYRKKVFNKTEFKAMLKAKLPEVDDDFINHFTDLASDFHIKKKALAAGIRKSEPVCKLEALTIELRKASDELFGHTTPTVRFAGHEVVPGHATTADGDYDLLHEDDHHYVGRPKGKNEAEDLVKLPKSKENSHFVVHRRPIVFVSDL